MQDFIDFMASFGAYPRNSKDVFLGADNELIADSRGRKTIYYSLDSDGLFGRFYDCRTGNDGFWINKDTKKLSPEERSAYLMRANKAKQDAQDIKEQGYKDAAIEASDYIARLSPASHNDYSRRKSMVLQPSAYSDGDALVYPLQDAMGKIWSYQTIHNDGTKLFAKGMKTKGCFYLYGTINPHDVIFLCEGIATGSTIYEATNKPVICTLSAGNHTPVALSIRGRYPMAKICIACDSDHWRFEPNKKPKGIDASKYAGDDPMWQEWREKGLLFNIGLEYGKQAAVRCNGFTFEPEVGVFDKEKRTDFNDIGVEATSEVLSKAFINHNANTPDANDEIVMDDDYMIDVGDESVNDNGVYLPFKCLGFNNGTYYYFSDLENQIVELTASAHTMANIMRLADYEDWRQWASSFSMNVSQSQLVTLATNFMLKKCRERGLFLEEDKVRGAGAWMDRGRVVIHCGDHLYVDGKREEMYTFNARNNTDYVYIMAAKVMKPAGKPLTSAQAIKLREICDMPNWETPMSGSLLAGWIVSAPVCAILNWRSHIWITGQSGTGKSTVVNRIIRNVLRDVAFSFEGGTTEPAIRALMGHDARPMIYDEAEPDKNNTTTMSNVLGLTRIASSGGVVRKYGQKNFRAQYAACFSSIIPPIKEFADERRISVLVLRKSTGLSALAEYNKFIATIEETLTPDFAHGLFSRTINNIDNFIKNVQIFKEAAASILKDSASADQISPMLAGLYLLSSTGVIEKKNAEQWIREREWAQYTTVDTEPDPIRLFRHIMTAIIPFVNNLSCRYDVTVGDIIASYYRIVDDTRLDKSSCERILRMYGIVLSPDGVKIANRSRNLEKILQNTPWASGWSRTLGELQGAEKIQNLKFSNSEPKQRGVLIPLITIAEQSSD